MTLPKAGVLLLGGGENGVSVARNLSALGIHVSASGEHGAWVLNSRYCDKRYPVPKGVDASNFWNDLLRSDSELEGSVIFPLCDDSITFVCQNKDWLKERYILEDFDPELRLAMLDKKETLEIARAAGVPTPNFWTVNSVEDLDAIRDEITFPVMVKPIHSHLFTKVFGCKLFIIKSDFEEARHKITLAQSHGLNVMLVEMIPGPDSLLSSYYTYIDQHGETLFDYLGKVECLVDHQVVAGKDLHGDDRADKALVIGQVLNVTARRVHPVQGVGDIRRLEFTEAIYDVLVNTRE